MITVINYLFNTMKFISSIIDYIWCVGERLRQQGDPISGTTNIQFFWYFTFLIPLYSIIKRLHIHPIIEIIIAIFLFLFPFIFCRLRYTPEYKEVVYAKHKNKKKWVGRYYILCGIQIMIWVIEAFVFVKIGLWHLGKGSIVLW